MQGAIFLPGEQKIRPGSYFRVVNMGQGPGATVAQGTVAVLFRSAWGPLGLGDPLESSEAARMVYGTAGTTDAITEAFLGQARTVIPYRLGTGGTAGTYTISDAGETPESVVRIDARYVGARSLRITNRDSLTDQAMRECLVYDGTELVDRFVYPAGEGEAAALVAAVAAQGSRWITATKLSDGSGTLATVSQQPLTGGTDPVVNGAAYDSAMEALEASDWNVLTVDSDEASIHTAVAQYVARVRTDGKRVLATVGEPTSVPFATRRTNAAAYNAWHLIYVGNGFTGSDGVVRGGYKAAARVAGMIASGAVTASLTHQPVTGATAPMGVLTNPQVEEALQSGMLVFTTNRRRQVIIEQGITTLVSPPANLDAGWKKIRRVRTRDHLMDRIADVWDPLIGQINNDDDGRATLIAAAQGEIDAMVAIGALLPDGLITLDPDNPPTGDSAWFVVAVDDVDSAEKLYARFGFRFAPSQV